MIKPQENKRPYVRYIHLITFSKNVITWGMYFKRYNLIGQNETRRHGMTSLHNVCWVILKCGIYKSFSFPFAVMKADCIIFFNSNLRSGHSLTSRRILEFPGLL